MRPPIFLYLLAVLGASLLPTLAPEARSETARLTVLHTTDLHGALTAYDYLADRPAPAGLVRIASLVRAARAEGPPVLLLDDGDAIQGGALETFYWRGDRARPEPMMTAMTRLGYDAMAVGNHEFSWGLAGLAKARAEAGFPWLAANVVRAPDGKPAFGTSIVKTLGGVRVGVVGLTTPAVPALEDSANWAGLRFLSPLEAGNAEAKRLREVERCDVVVVLAHTGLEQDPATEVERQGDAPDENWGTRLAAGLQGVDVLILGHTHAALVEAEPARRAAGRAGGPQRRVARPRGPRADPRRPAGAVAPRAAPGPDHRPGRFGAGGRGAGRLRRALPRGRRRPRSPSASARPRRTSARRTGAWPTARSGTWSTRPSSRPPARTSRWPRSSIPRPSSAAAR